MVKCNSECPAICDFCRTYDFNGKPVQSADGKSATIAYTGDGQCKHPDHPAQREPYESCDDFHCKRAEVHSLQE